MELRPYQQQVIEQIYEAWEEGAQNVCVQLATGAGKTVIFSHIIANYPYPTIAVAHRMELVSQISLTLAKHGIRHNLIAQKHTIRETVSLHMLEFGKSFFDIHAQHFVAGIDTLIKLPQSTGWMNTIRLIVQDEGHHPLRENKWGRVAALFPRAYGLYPTATPTRADGKGLGRHADGIYDKLIVGIGMRDLICAGYLTDYRIFAPPMTIDLTNVPTSSGGDYSPPKLREAVHKSRITGDVVSHYLRLASGKSGITFAVDIEAATELATAYKAAGVAAEVISSKTPELLRAAIMRKFKNREILQLVNVDILGEGFDVPAIEVVSMARPTQSYALYSQQFGRALRPMENKQYAYIIDHTTNVLRHGLPDAPRQWTLDRRNRRGKDTQPDVPLRVCTNRKCLLVYPRTLAKCPHCGYKPPVLNRALPEQVDGDLLELDTSVLNKLRGEIESVDGTPRIPKYLDSIAQLSIAKRHKERQVAQRDLRNNIAIWAGYLKEKGFDDSAIYKMFYFKFNVDIMTAQTFSKREANELNQKVIDEIRIKV